MRSSGDVHYSETQKLLIPRGSFIIIYYHYSEGSFYGKWIRIRYSEGLIINSKMELGSFIRNEKRVRKSQK